MYAKIVTLLALLFGSLSGLTAATQSASGHDVRVDTVEPSVENVQELRVESVNEREDEPEQDGSTFEPVAGCHPAEGEVIINPEAEALANELALPYESILAWFCAGNAEPTIRIAYDMSVMAGVSLDEIFQMRVVEGLSWAEIAEAFGLPTDHGDWVSDAPGEPGDEGGGEQPPVGEDPPIIRPDDR